MAQTPITSTLPGVFYRKPSPDQPPYVKEGEQIEEGQTIGLVEIMKQFSEIKAPAAGTIKSFAVEDGAMIDPGATIAILDDQVSE